MDANDGMILWVLGGAGTVLLYAAYKGTSPLAVLTDHIKGASSPAQTAVPQPGSSAGLDATSPAYDASGVPYSIHQDSTGTQYVYNGDGSPIGTLPSTYGHTPGTYIPSEY